jgi:hypothetical protein
LILIFDSGFARAAMGLLRELKAAELSERPSALEDATRLFADHATQRAVAKRREVPTKTEFEK